VLEPAQTVVSTRINPGAFQRRKVRGLRAIARGVGRALRQRRYDVAALTVAADTLNLVEARVGTMFAPRFRCSCCGEAAHAFWHVASGTRVAWNSACPSCDSRSRHRGLAVLLPELIAQHGPHRVLHFAPEPVLRPCFDVPGLTYETADLVLEDVTHRHADVQALPFEAGRYDMIVCNHVLEHVPDDARAIGELHRMLSPRGIAVITVPGDFRRAETVHFTGELDNGHYRDYGLDFAQQLRARFRTVTVIDLHDFDRGDDGLSRAIRKLDLAFVCAP